MALREHSAPEGVREKQGTSIWGAVIKISLFALLVYGVFGHLIGVAVVEGEGMYPSVERGSVIVFYRLAETIQRGDMVVIEEGGKQMLLRAIAVGGDLIEIDAEHNVRINGEKEDRLSALGETELRWGSGGTYQKRLENGMLHVLGDNRERAYDSRDFGEVSEATILGKVILTIKGY